MREAGEYHATAMPRRRRRPRLRVRGLRLADPDAGGNAFEGSSPECDFEVSITSEGAAGAKSAAGESGRTIRLLVRRDSRDPPRDALEVPCPRTRSPRRFLMTPTHPLRIACTIVAATLVAAACQTTDAPVDAAGETSGAASGSASMHTATSAGDAPPNPSDPPPAIAAWMDRLTVAHAYDPETGFIVARETISLPPLLADAPPLDVAIAEAGPDRLVVVFATADRCAPCQQFKKDALNDPAVIERLAETRFLATHIEVDRAAELAEAHLESRAIPMSHALRDGAVIATLRGQRSAAELMAWLDALPASPPIESDAGEDEPA